MEQGTLASVKRYNRLSDALDSRSGSEFVFAEEIVAEKFKGVGFRFLVVNLEAFWNGYENLLPSERRFYEVILHGKPCKLYFDLEYSRAENKRSKEQEEKTMAAFKKFVVRCLIECFGAQTDSILDLQSDSVQEGKTKGKNSAGNSSLASKFSRHLIFSLKDGAAFRDNEQVGMFVIYIWQKLEKLRESRQIDEDLESVFVLKKDGSETIFVDPAVYTKNRLFRIYLSSKAGRNMFLVPAQVCDFYLKRDQEIFYSSLVGNVQECQRLLEMPNSSYNSLKNLKAPQQTFNSKGTFFPDLDKFILSLQPGNPRPGIRSCVFSSDPPMMTYFLSNNRFCRRISRAHKSNHIYFVVDLRLKVSYQKCTDWECREFRSEMIHLPENILQRRIFDELEFHDSIEEQILMDFDNLVDFPPTEISLGNVVKTCFSNGDGFPDHIQGHDFNSLNETEEQKAVSQLEEFEAMYLSKKQI